MASSKISSQLSQVENSSPQQRADGFKKVLQAILSSNDNLADSLTAYVQSITSDSIGVMHSRPLLSGFVEEFRNIKDNDVKIEAG